LKVTVCAAGLIFHTTHTPADAVVGRATRTFYQYSAVIEPDVERASSRIEAQAKIGQRGQVVWFTPSIRLYEISKAKRA